MIVASVYGVACLVMVWAAVDLNKSHSQVQWERLVKMCKTSERYHAMRQAYALHVQNPCERHS